MLPFGGAKNRAAAGLSIALPLHTVCGVICCLDSGEKKKVYGYSWSFFETATPVTVARTIALNNLRPRNRLLIRGMWQNASIVFFDVVKDKALAELRIEKRTFTSSCCLADAAVERSGWNLWLATSNRLAGLPMRRLRHSTRARRFGSSSAATAYRTSGPGCSRSTCRSTLRAIRI
jgi:hypothetical protein